MIIASLALLFALWAAALGACWTETVTSARTWLSIMGILIGIGLVMLSGRTIGLLWLMVGAMALLIALGPEMAARAKVKLICRPQLTPRLLWATPLALLWLGILLWQPPANMPLAPQAVELAQVVGIAFAHHTWAVVGVVLLGLLTLVSCSSTEES